MTATTLVVGSSAARREAAICAALQPTVATAVLLEGLASGADAFAALDENPRLRLVRIARGCLCCSGNLTMRVTLNRLLRQRPERLYISLASTEHLAAIQELLSSPPYTAWLKLAETLHIAP